MPDMGQLAFEGYQRYITEMYGGSVTLWDEQPEHVQGAWRAAAQAVEAALVEGG